VDLGDGLSSGHGFATAVEETDFSRVYAHTGGIGGFRVRIAYYVEKDLTVVVLANCESAPVARLETAIARAALDLLPADVVDLQASPAEIAACSGTWQIATQRVRTFERSGRLFFENADLPPFALLYQGQHVFVAATDHSVRITFRVVKEKPAESFEIVRPSLETVFLELTGHGAEEIESDDDAATKGRGRRARGAA
jgi:CubicO group peptidase (beta-lactamase class C family)